MSVCAGADPPPNSCGKSGEGVGWGGERGKLKEKGDLKGRRKIEIEEKAGFQNFLPIWTEITSWCSFAMQAFGNINSKTFCHYFAQEISVTTQYFGTYRHMSVLLFREKSKLLLPIPRSSFELSVGGRFGQNSSSSLIPKFPNKPTMPYQLIVPAQKI